MNWFQANRWLGKFVIALGGATLLALVFLFYARSNFSAARTEFDQAAAERNRLEGRDPFPSEANYGKLKLHIDTYASALEKFKEELKGRILPAAPLAPNEFQTRLRQAMVASAEKARANKVKLPDNFALGFNEFTAVLPSNELAPLLGQELAQAELLVNILIEARVDGVTRFARAPLASETVAPASAARPPATTAPKVIERNVIDLSFMAAPSNARRALNQIASASQQLYLIRTLHVRNEKEKGPAREQTGATTAATPAASAAINFIVGNEHIETSARIEMLRLAF